MGDDFIIVTESFIRQLNNEDQMIKTESQGSKLVFIYFTLYFGF